MPSNLANVAQGNVNNISERINDQLGNLNRMGKQNQHVYLKKEQKLEENGVPGGEEDLMSLKEI